MKRSRKMRRQVSTWNFRGHRLTMYHAPGRDYEIEIARSNQHGPAFLERVRGETALQAQVHAERVVDAMLGD